MRLKKTTRSEEAAYELRLPSARALRRRSQLHYPKQDAKDFAAFSAQENVGAMASAGAQASTVTALGNLVAVPQSPPPVTEGA